MNESELKYKFSTFSYLRHKPEVKTSAWRYKCNIDTLFSFSRNKVDIGMCIRDNNIDFVLARLFGLLCCVYLIFEKHWSYIQLGNIDFVLDSKKVNYFHWDSRDITKFGTIINNCKNYCNLHFQNSYVEFSLKQANEVAHILVRIAISLASFHTFIDVSPCIYDSIYNEML